MTHTILVVEDDKALREALATELKEANFTVLVSTNGEEAVKTITNNKVDLVVLDLIMPIVDGYGFLHKMQEHGLNVPVIVLTNVMQPREKQRAESYNIVEYLIKSNTSLAKITSKVTHFINTKTT